MAEHSKLSFSSGKRWLKCTGCIELIAKHGVFTPNAAAQEGTAAHLVWEHQMAMAGFFSKTHPRDLQAQVGALNPTQYDIPAMIENSGYMFDLMKALINGREHRVLVEEQVRLEGLSDDLWGTADLIVHVYDDDGDELHIVDYKYGRSPVPAVENEQLLLYLMGAIKRLGLSAMPDMMQIHIVQPRVSPPIKSWVVKLDYLMKEFLPRVQAAVKAIESGKTELVASAETCRYCPAIASCPAAAKVAEEACDFAALNEMQPFEQTLAMLPVVRDWADAVEAQAMKALKSGQAIDGWELKPGVSRRKWVNEDQVIDYLTKTKRVPLKDVAPRKLAGITTIEKLIKGRKNIDMTDLSPYISKPPGKPKLSRVVSNIVPFEPIEEIENAKGN